VSWVLQALLDLLAHRVRPGRPATALVLQALLDLLAHRVRPGRPATALVLQALLDLLAHRVRPGRPATALVLQALLDLLAHRVRPGRPATALVLRARPVLPVLRARPVLMDWQVLSVLKVRLEPRARKALLDQLAHRVRPGRPATALVLRARPVLPVLRARPVLMDWQVLSVLKVRLEPRARKALLDLLAHRVRPGRPATA
jgi:hypothetical protein